MLLSTSNPTPSSQVTVKKSGENLNPPTSMATLASSTTSNHTLNSSLFPMKEEQRNLNMLASSSLSAALSLQPMTTKPNVEASSSYYPQQQQFESKASSDSNIPPSLRLQPPTTTNFPIITSSNRPPTPTTTTGHPTFHSSFPIMTNNFLAPPLFSSKSPNNSLSNSVGSIPSVNVTPTRSNNLENLPKPVPTASSILAPSLSHIETESISPQPVRVSTILSSFNTPSESSNQKSLTIAPQTEAQTLPTPKITRVRRLTQRRVSEPVQQQNIATTTKISEPTTPVKEQPTKEVESNPFATLYSKPLSSFPLHHPSSVSGGFSPFPPSSSNASSRLLASPSTPSPISLWPSTNPTTNSNKQVVPPPPIPLNISPPNAKKRKVNSQDSIGASLQPLTPLTPSPQYPFPSVRLASASPSGYVPPPFPIPSLTPKVTIPERKVSNNTGADTTPTRPKKKENMVGCNSIRIPFKSWMKTLDTLSAPSLRAVQERVTQLLEKKESEKKKSLQSKQQETINQPSKLSNETLSLLSTDLASIDTLAILALADSPPSPNLETKSSEVISESVELFPSKSPEKSMMIELDDSEEESDEEEMDLKSVRVDPFVREYSGSGFIYPGRRGAKSQRVRLPLCFFPSMKLVMVSEGNPEMFVEGDEIVNPVIDLEHHLEFFINDYDKKLYNSIKGLHLMLLKRISKNCYVESSILVKRSARSDDGGYNFSVINQSSLNRPVPGQRQPDYSLFLVETRGKRKNSQEVDKVNRCCEIVYEQITNQCKIRVGFRICKAQKKKHTKGIYLLRLVACISDEEEVKFNSSHQPINGTMKVLEESEMFKIVSRRATVERTRTNFKLKRKFDDDDAQADSSSE